MEVGDGVQRHESLGELGKAVETLAYGSCSHGISGSVLNFHSYLYKSVEARYMFSIS